MGLKIKKIKNFPSKLLLFLFLIIFSNQELYDLRILRWPIFGLICVSIFMNILTKKQVGNLKFLKWIFLFGFIILLSLIWTVSLDFSFMAIKIIMYNSIIVSFLYLLINTEDDFYSVLKIYILAVLLTAGYILFSIDISDMLGMRIGAQSLGDAWNSNDIARIMSFGSFFSFIIYNNLGNKLSLKKLNYALITLFLAVIVVLTGSRQGLIILIVSIGIFHISVSKNMRFIRIISVLLFAILVVYFGYNIPILYDLYGEKIQDAFQIINRSNDISVSDLTRMEMIESGISYFKQKPIIGYGIYSFSYLYGLQTGIPNYAHNNYVDLLVGLGIIGLIIYYSSYFYLLIKTFNKSHKNLVIAFAGVLSLFIGDITVVSYFKLDMLLFLSILYSSLRVFENHNKLDSIKESATKSSMFAQHRVKNIFNK